MKPRSDTVLLAVIVAVVIIEVTALILGRDGVLALGLFAVLGAIAGIPIAKRFWK